MVRRSRHRQYLEERPVRKPPVWRLLIFPLVLLVMVWFVYNLSNIAQQKTEAQHFLFTRSHLPLDSQQQYDVNLYDLSLRFSFPRDSARPYVQGKTKIVFTSRKTILKELQLDFNSTLRIDSIGGNLYRYQWKDGIITIALRHPLVQGKQDSLVVYYSGYPQPYHPWVKGMAFTWRRRSDYAAVPWVNTMNPPFGAQTWFPCKDVPWDKADSAVVRISVPDTLMGVSNGKLVATDSANGWRTYIWKTRYSIAPYLIAVNVGDYREYRFDYTSISGKTFPVVFYYFNEDVEVLQEVEHQVRRMFRFFEHRLGPYPFPDEKYGMILYNNGGGMENQTISSVQTFSPQRERLFAHELSHQWVGDWVTNADFHQSFLNEGLATYLTALYWRDANGDSAFNAYMERLRVKEAGPLWIEHILVPDSVYSTSRVYFKGAWFFRMLHEMVGDSVFWTALRNYLTRHAFQTVTYTDLLSAFPQSARVSDYFQSWVFNDGVPRITLRWKKKAENGRFARYTVEVRQENDDPFVFLLPVTFYTAMETVEKDFWITRKKQSFQVDFTQPVDSLQVQARARVLLNLLALQKQ